MAVEYADFSSVGLELIQQQQQLESLQTSQKQSLFLPSEINDNSISMALFENQRVEIDRFMNLQNERLKVALRVQRMQQMSWLIRKVESRVAMVTRQKDEEILKARNRVMELEGYMKRLEMENLGWRRIAGEGEAMIANLNASIQQLTDKAEIAIRLQQQKKWIDCDVEDAESCCDVSFEEETGSERNSKRKKMMMVCKRCDNGDSSVLFLPCMHLCCCKACEASLYNCPVCNSAKQGSIEALFS